MSCDERDALAKERSRRATSSPPRSSGPARPRAPSPSPAARAASASRRSRPTSPWRWRSRVTPWRSSTPTSTDPRCRSCSVCRTSVPRPTTASWSRPTAHGVKVVSMGLFLDGDEPVIWRGPMLGRAIEQFLGDVLWGSPDFLLIDLPPGTGDIALTVAQMIPDAEMVIVTTPQEAAARTGDQGRQDGADDQASRRGRHREHGLLRLPGVRDAHTTSSGAAERSRSPGSWTPGSSVGSRSTRRRARAATPARRPPSMPRRRSARCSTTSRICLPARASEAGGPDRRMHRGSLIRVS